MARMAAGITVAAALATLGLAGPAAAGTYSMYQCRGPSGSPAPISAQWQVGGASASGLYVNCGSNGPFGFGVGQVRYGDLNSISIAVPSSQPGITIAKVASTVDSGGGTWDGDSAVFRQWNGGTVYTQDGVGWGPDPDSYSRTGEVTTASGTRGYAFGFFCGGGNNGADCTTTDNAHAQRIWSVQFTLAESVPPSAAATGGSLLDGGTVGGHRSLSFTATDADSGVKRVVARLGDTVLADQSFDAQCPQTDFNACPNSITQSGVDVDTGRAPDGTWPLYFDVTDAAGNTATVDSGKTVTTANGNGGGPRSGSGNPVVKLSAPRVRKRYGQHIVITGQTVGADGSPLGNMDVQVLSKVASGGDFANVDKLRSGPDGSFSYTAADGPNRTLAFRYTAPGADGKPTDYEIDVPVEVRAAAHLAVSKERIRPGARVTFRGQLLGGPFPARGVPIGFRGRVGRHTRRFGDLQTDSKGRFKLSYRFGRRGPNATYPVWVHVGADGSNYPYLPGTSNHVRVRVHR